MDDKMHKADWRIVIERVTRGVVLLASGLILLVVFTLLIDGVRNCGNLAASARARLNASSVAEKRVARSEASWARGHAQNKEHGE
jgi:hypothetical protein